MPAAPKAEILKIADLAAYQEGAIVSRQIITAEGGNVTLFAFDQGQELSEHTAPFDALLHLLEGEVEVRISGKAFQLKAGEAIILPAGQPHAVKAQKKFKMLLTMIHV